MHMHYRRKYVQYNNLVFADADMIDEDDYAVSFKTFDKEYTFRRGSYYPLKSEYAIAKMSRVSFTIRLHMMSIPCEDRPFYVRHAIDELMRPGRLWAVRDNHLVWAWASITNYREDKDDKKDTFSIDVSFDLPEGVWHKANTLRTFLMPHDPCDFMDCYDFRDVELCRPLGHCCECGAKEELHCNCCDNCEDIYPEAALCYQRDLQPFYDNCGAGWRIVYSCEAAKKYFSDFLNDDHVGQKFCTDCGSTIAGILYSDTEVPTDGVKITLHGTFHNPYIEINGNGNTIKGDFEGVVEIYPDGTVYTYKDGCGCDDALPATTWVIPKGMEYGWTVRPGKNRLVIDTGTCCHACAWVEIDALAV